MSRTSARAVGGFTLVEMLVVLCLATILLALGLPALQTTMHQAKLRGVAQEVSVLMRQARLNAVKTVSQSVVRVELPAGDQPGRVEGFADLDSNGLFGGADRVLGSIPLPTGIQFVAPPSLTGAASVDGLSPDPLAPALPRIAIFQRNGSIAAVGAFRFADTYGNFLEVRIEPAATARIELRKAREDGGSWLWYASGDGGQAWEWN